MHSPAEQPVHWPERKVTYKQKLLPEFENMQPETLDSKHISELMRMNTIRGVSTNDKAKIVTLLVPDTVSIPLLSADVREKLTAWQLEQFSIRFELPNRDQLPEYIYEPAAVSLHDEPKPMIDEQEVAKAA
jgi:hypothetical protein